MAFVVRAHRPRGVNFSVCAQGRTMFQEALSSKHSAASTLQQALST